MFAGGRRALGDALRDPLNAPANRVLSSVKREIPETDSYLP